MVRALVEFLVRLYAEQIADSPCGLTSWWFTLLINPIKQYGFSRVLFRRKLLLYSATENRTMICNEYRFLFLFLCGNIHGVRN